MKRRDFLQFLMAGGAVYLTPAGKAFAMFGGGNKKEFPVQMSDAEWREKLPREAYEVLRKHDTEPPFSSPLNEEKREGEYVCAGCGNVVFLSEHKYDSGTGWPSFYKPASEEAIGTQTDFKLILPRTEVHCARCGGHLGHVFEDGPKPTGLRYCMNGAAMSFRPDYSSLRK